MGAILSSFSRSARKESLITSRQLAFMADLSTNLFNTVSVRDKNDIIQTISMMAGDPEQAILLKQSGTLRLLLQLSTEYSRDPRDQKLREDAAGILQCVALSGYNETSPHDFNQSNDTNIIRMLNCMRLFCFHECEQEPDNGVIKFTCTTKFTCMETFKVLELFLQNEIQMKAFLKLCGVDALAMLMVTRQQALRISCDPENRFTINICNIFTNLIEQINEFSLSKQKMVEELRNTVLSTPGVLSTWRSYLEMDKKDLRLALAKLINYLVCCGTQPVARLLTKEGFIQVLIQQIMEEKSTWNLTFPVINTIMILYPPSMEDAIKTEAFLQFLIDQFVHHSTSDIHLDYLIALDSTLLVLIDKVAESEKLFNILLRSGILRLWQHQLESTHLEIQHKAFYILLKVCQHKSRLMANMGLMQALEQFKHSSSIEIAQEYYDFETFIRRNATWGQEGNKEEMISGG